MKKSRESDPWGLAWLSKAFVRRISQTHPVLSLGRGICHEEGSSQNAHCKISWGEL